MSSTAIAPPTAWRPSRRVASHKTGGADRPRAATDCALSGLARCRSSRSASKLAAPVSIWPPPTPPSARSLVEPERRGSGHRARQPHRQGQPGFVYRARRRGPIRERMPELQQRKNPLCLPPPNCLQEDGFAALVQHKGRYDRAGFSVFSMG
jgi:hypothetical protein